MEGFKKIESGEVIARLSLFNQTINQECVVASLDDENGVYAASITFPPDSPISAKIKGKKVRVEIYAINETNE